MLKTKTISPFWRVLKMTSCPLAKSGYSIPGMLTELPSTTIHPWRRQWHPTPVLLPGKSHGRRSLVGCSSWSRKESDMTERLHFHFSLSWIGEGNGSPLQCFCLENPRDGGAWWATICGAAQSQTRLKWLRSSSSNHSPYLIFHPHGIMNSMRASSYHPQHQGLCICALYRINGL